MTRVLRPEQQIHHPIFRPFDSAAAAAAVAVCTELNALNARAPILFIRRRDRNAIQQPETVPPYIVARRRIIGNSAC